jgi:hypothetical protein
MAVALCGCRSHPRPAHPTRWAKAWIAAVNSHQLVDFDGLLKPTGTYEDSLTNGPRSGPALAYFFILWWHAFPRSHLELQRVTADGDVVVADWTATGLGADTANKPLEGVFVIQPDGDAIASVRGYYDASAFGVKPSPSQGRVPDQPARPPGSATLPAVPRR